MDGQDEYRYYNQFDHDRYVSRRMLLHGILEQKERAKAMVDKSEELAARISWIDATAFQKAWAIFARAREIYTWLEGIQKATEEIMEENGNITTKTELLQEIADSLGSTKNKGTNVPDQPTIPPLPQDKLDNVNHPSHYADSCSLECIDVMEAIFGRDCVATWAIINAFKYIWRHKNKNGKEDIEKAKWYMNYYNNAVSASFMDDETADVIQCLIKRFENE